TERVDAVRGRLQGMLGGRSDLTALDFDALLTSVTELVEESYFSGRLYDDALWELAVGIVRRLDRQLGVEPEKEGV
ncbi:MAG: hypothetical protein GY884_23335, partial [Proteobacteria bacterium]|nr:hypothetical protein [Pseudomonadota bacterium]